MHLIVPTYFETRKRDGSREPVYRCRPLFFEGPVVEHQELGRATAKLAEQLRNDLSDRCAGGEEKLLAAYHYDAPLVASTHKLKLDLRTAMPEAKYLLVQVPFQEARVAFSPSLPGIWFDVERGASMTDRAAEVYSQHFCRLMRREHSTPELCGLEGKAWVASIELEVRPPRDKKKEETGLAALFSTQPMDGCQELHRVGRSLGEKAVEDLTRCVHREREVEEVARLLGACDRRPIAIVGRPLVGKSSLLHEVVRRWAEKEQARDARKTQKADIWLVSPQRLVSGMQYVGQWEDRVLAILKYAVKAKQVLWFDDVPGLYLAGVTRDSRLSVADVIRDHIGLARRARFVFEMTHEQLSQIRETDRRFTDQLHVVRLEEPDDTTTTQILIATAARLEAKHRCRFSSDVIPVSLDLTRRHDRANAQPGKAARLITELAVQHRDDFVSRGSVLGQFHRKTGVSLQLLDDATTLDRQQLLENLNARVIGQREATDAIADVAVRAKSHLADPGRPLATMLFMGPTGVGKTHCAKAMADLLFGSDDSLVRLDMNEFVSARSALRLIGTPMEPAGLLTSPVLRRPHCVVLLDEIEKAHPDVFDLLLQVLGEGRLTDHRGRTVDFTQCVLVMTSNLGTAESSRRIQLSASEDNRVPLKAAESFFRPEMFNRIDRVIAFDPLGRAEIRLIVDSLLTEVFGRDGFARRRCLMEVHPQVRSALADAGFDPKYGARALRRVIERDLCCPVAEQLSEISLETPALIRLLPSEGGMRTDVVPLLECDLEYAGPKDRTALREGVQQLLCRVEPCVQALKPVGGFSVGSHDSNSLTYYAISDLIFQLRQKLELLKEESKSSDSPEPDNTLPHTQARRSLNMPHRSQKGLASRRILKEVASNDDINAYFDGLGTEDFEASGVVDDVARSAALLEWLDPSGADSIDETSGVLWYRSLAGNTAESANGWLDIGDGDLMRSIIRSEHEVLFGEKLGLDVRRVSGSSSDVALSVSGAGAGRLAQRETGIHLLIDPGQMSGVRVDWIPTSQVIENWNEFEEHGPQRWQLWMSDLLSGKAGVLDEPLRPGKVIRVYHISSLDFLRQATAHDLRTGRRIEIGDSEQFFNMFLDGLPSFGQRDATPHVTTPLPG